MRKMTVFVLESPKVADSSIQKFIARAEWLRTIGTATSANETLAKLKSQAPDLILLHCSNRRSIDPNFLRLLRRESPSSKIVSVSDASDGCSPSQVKEISATTNLKQTHHKFLSILRETIRHDAAHSQTEPKSPELSAREQEVLTLIGNGLLDKEIAAKLGIGVRAIDTHKEHIRQKLGLRNKVEMVAFAVRKCFAV